MENRVWLIGRVNRKFINRLEDEIFNDEFDVEVYIPTVRYLKKQVKGKKEFEDIPMLFGYAFFSLPYEDACNIEYLLHLRDSLTALLSWVKDRAVVNEYDDLREQVIHGDHDDEELDFDLETGLDILPSYDDDFVKAARATDEEIKHLKKVARNFSVFAEDDVAQLKEGDDITLKGYPFDNIPATIISINKRKKEVKVRIETKGVINEVTVAFENVFYTVYNDNMDSGQTISFDDLDTKGKVEVSKKSG